jgi:hypothetical protein
MNDANTGFCLHLLLFIFDEETKWGGKYRVQTTEKKGKKKNKKKKKQIISAGVVDTWQ